MSSTFDHNFKINQLKNNVSRFVAATSSGTLTPAQVRQLGALLQDNVEILETIFIANTDVAIKGKKIGQN